MTTDPHVLAPAVDSIGNVTLLSAQIEASQTVPISTILALLVLPVVISRIRSASRRAASKLPEAAS